MIYRTDEQSSSREMKEAREYAATPISGALPVAWYAIRTRPGAQRVAAEDVSVPVTERVKFQYIIERQCAKRGYECLTPSFWTVVKHARTHKILTKRFPFLTGYTFVNVPDRNFERLRNEVAGVLYIVRDMNGPIEFPSYIIDKLRADDWQERRAFERGVFVADEKSRVAEINKLRGSLRRIVPKGRAVRFNIEAQAEMAIERLPPRARERVRAIQARLKQLEAQPALAEMAEAV